MSIAAALAELEKSVALLAHVAYLQEFIAAEQTRREQFRRGFAGQRGEFINGRVFVPPPASPSEQDAIACTRALLTRFVKAQIIGKIFGGNCLVQCQRNDYTPDVCFFGAARAAGLSPEALFFPPPDLAVEVLAPATTEHDRKLKWQDYAQHGVGEYWLMDADDRMIEQYVLPPGRENYELRARLPEGGRLNSTVVAGLSIPVAALFDPHANQKALRAMAGPP